jgi:lactoylglutathione lyase
MDTVVISGLVDDPTEDSVGCGGLSHFVVRVEDLHATVGRLAARGIEAAEPGSPDGSEDFWTSWVYDPDRHRIGLAQWPSGYADGMTRGDLADLEERR